MKIKVMKREFSVCKVDDISRVDFTDRYCFLGKTDEEISVICSTRNAPEETVARSDGWRAFRIQGELEFSLIGLVSELTGILAEAKISVLTVATYNTDYLLVKAENLERALELLAEQDYKIIR